MIFVIIMIEIINILIKIVFYIYTKKKKTVLTTLQPKAFKTVCYGSHTKALKQFDTLPTQN